MPKLEPLDMDKYEIVDEPQSNQDWDGEGNNITTARDKVLGEVSQCPLCYCMTHTVDEKCGKCNSPKKPDSSVDQDKDPMTHQLEELRQKIDNALDSFEKEIRADITNHINGDGSRNAGFSHIDARKDFEQLIAQHDTELLGEILKQKRTIGTGELFDECEVVDVSVIEQYQPKAKEMAS